MPVDPYALADEAAAAVSERSGVARHDVAVVLGSGWLPAADLLGEVGAELAFADLPGFPAPTVAGHGASVRSVESGGRHLLVFLGRIHAYEGHAPSTVAHLVRTAVRAGCGTVVLTNAAGGLRAGMFIGQPVVISDHLNLTGRSPLAGPEPPPEAGWGPRFCDLTDAYSPRLRAVALEAEPTLTEGVYAAVPGPHYETPAEIRAYQALGADLVGMSTVHEVIAARQAGAEVLALSLVTNLAAGLGAEKLSHTEVLDAGRAAAARMGALLAGLVPRL
ncbi:MAG: purine-nucleoside phosphorylase [Acidimicrobiia bacterium]|nr:purine-nucleoside phosphorylase [Acidimicrobiia bacterium]